MPTATPTVKRNAIPSGDHLFCLISVEEVQQPDFNDATKEVTRWIWQFKSKQRDPETGELFEFRQYTGPKYGNPRAGLTILLDQMLPDWSDAQKGNIDTDKIINSFYKARIRHEKAEKPDDPPKPRLVMIEPFKPKTTGATAAPTHAPGMNELGEVDEFADGVRDPFENMDA